MLSVIVLNNMIATVYRARSVSDFFEIVVSINVCGVSFKPQPNSDAGPHQRPI